MARNKVAIEIKDFKGGSNLLLDEARLAPNDAKTAQNLIQVQDGLWQPRWGTAVYGKDIGSTIDGAKEFVKSDGTRELIAVSATKVLKSTDGGTWSEITGATFTAGTQCFFMQLAGYLYIVNGTDTMARYDGTNLLTYTQLSAPASLTASRVVSGLSSGTYTYYGEVTALNQVGETVGSNEATVTVNKSRDAWVATTDKGIHWSWAAVASATQYQLYISNSSGRETLLAATPDTFFVDDGSKQINDFVEVLYKTLLLRLNLSLWEYQEIGYGEHTTLTTNTRCIGRVRELI